MSVYRPRKARSILSCRDSYQLSTEDRKTCEGILLVIRFMIDLLRKYRGSVVIMVGRGGAEPHYVHK